MASNRSSHLHSFKPFLHAYVLAYLAVVAPSSVKPVISLLRCKSTTAETLHQLRSILKKATQINRLPLFAAILCGGSSLLQAPLRSLLRAVLYKRPGLFVNLSPLWFHRLARFLAALLASYFAFILHNGETTNATNVQNAARILPDRDHGPSEMDPRLDNSKASLDVLKKVTAVELPNDVSSIPAQAMTSDRLGRDSTKALAGRSIDITLLLFTRAADLLLSSLWTATGPHSGTADRLVTQVTTPALFSLSVATIMHAWFYAPHSLPRTYVRWISAAAELDPRLMEALRQARYGKFIYGQETGLGNLLGSMAVDHGIPYELGDPAKTIPVACEIVHSGAGPSCEVHALVRFVKGWIFAARMYAPLQLVMLLRGLQSGRLRSMQGRKSALAKAATDTARSSAFLGAFISLFYYGVCTGRTRLGPRIFDKKTVSPQMWDGGLCVLTGCLACGWSILLEKERRRSELMFFVLPRALSAWFPRRYSREHRWKEHLVFSVSTALVLTSVQERPESVRGLLGSVLGQIMN